MNGRLQLQVAAAIRRRGTEVVLRAVTRTGSPQMPNPPTFVNPVLATPLAPGATALSINASSAFGVILAGDILLVDGQSLTVTTQVRSRPNTANNAGFDAISFSPPFTGTGSSGDPVLPTWSADINTWAVVSSFPLNLIDGQLIIVGDMNVVMPALDGFNPKLPWKLILPDGVERTLISASPNYVQDQIVSWRALAR